MLARGTIGSFLVLIGGLVTATLPPSAPALQLHQLGELRTTEIGRMIGLLLVLLGLGLLASSWLQLCRVLAVGEGEAADPKSGIALVRHTCVLWSLPLLIAPPLFSRDGWSYAAQGMLQRVGLSPYEWGPGALVPTPAPTDSAAWDAINLLPAKWNGPPIVQAVDPIWFDTATPYGPLPISLGARMADITGNPWVLVIGHRLIALVGLVVLAWAVPKLARWTGTNPALASGLVLISPLMMANGVAGLHNDLLMAGLMAAALVVGVERGWFFGAVLAALAASVKIPGGLVAIGIALATVAVGAPMWRRLLRLAQVGVVSLGTLLGLGVVTGVGNGWIAALTVPGVINTPLSATTLVGGVIDFAAHLVGLDTPDAFFRDLVRSIGLGVALLVCIWVALRWKTGVRSTAIAAVATTAGTFVLLSPVVHLWYFLLLPPFLATLRAHRAVLGGLVAVSVITGLVAPLDSSLHGAYYAIVLGCMTVVLLAPVLLLTPGARDQIARIIAPLAPEDPVDPASPAGPAGLVDAVAPRPT